VDVTWTVRRLPRLHLMAVTLCLPHVAGEGGGGGAQLAQQVDLHQWWIFTHPIAGNGRNGCSSPTYFRACTPLSLHQPLFSTHLPHIFHACCRAGHGGQGVQLRC